jgi:hypothetical protein
MIDALERKFGRIAAAGLMARAALSLGYEETKGEQESIITQLVDEARNRLGINREDNEPNTLSRIADFLDSESDKLFPPANTNLALARLAGRGDLPSDLYEINIIKNVSDIHGKNWQLEKELIETTIRDFTQEQHYGPPKEPHEPAMISLFARSFITKWLVKDFVMLVAAKREGFKLDVHQAWRIYPSKMNIAGANTPVKLLQRFADTYGAEIDINGTIGHFFLFSSTPAPSAFKFNMGRAKERNIVVSQFNQNDSSGRPNSALIVAIDLDKYKITLRTFGVRREDIIDEFAKVPKAIL